VLDERNRSTVIHASTGDYWSMLVNIEDGREQMRKITTLWCRCRIVDLRMLAGYWCAPMWWSAPSMTMVSVVHENRWQYPSNPRARWYCCSTGPHIVQRL
jgi:hypothetical protein